MLAALGDQLGIDHFGVILVITAISLVINKVVIFKVEYNLTFGFKSSGFACFGVGTCVTH